MDKWMIYVTQFIQTSKMNKWINEHTYDTHTNIHLLKMGKWINEYVLLKHAFIEIG